MLSSQNSFMGVVRKALSAGAAGTPSDGGIIQSAVAPAATQQPAASPASAAPAPEPPVPAAPAPVPSASPAPSPTPAPTASPSPAPAAPAPTSPSPAPSASSSPASLTYTPWNVTPQQTVEDRINSIINGGSPIINSARARADDAMNARGLTNSSLGVSAAESAAYDAALPIATADAATYAKAAGYNSDIQNQMAMQGRQLGSQEQIARLNADTSIATANISAETQKQIASLNADTQRYTAQLDASTRTQVQQMQNENQKLLQTNSNAAQAFNQSMVAIANIEQNDRMDASAKQAAIAQIMQNLQMQMKTLGTVAGIDLSGTLDFRNMPGFDQDGRWVGLPSTGSGDTQTSGSDIQWLRGALQVLGSGDTQTSGSDIQHVIQQVTQ